MFTSFNRYFIWAWCLYTVSIMSQKIFSISSLFITSNISEDKKRSSHALRIVHLFTRGKNRDVVGVSLAISCTIFSPIDNVLSERCAYSKHWIRLPHGPRYPEIWHETLSGSTTKFKIHMYSKN